MPAEFFGRHRELRCIAKQFRLSGLQSHIRLGKNDYMLFTRPLEDYSNWLDNDQYILPNSIEKFQLGKVSSPQTYSRDQHHS